MSQAGIVMLNPVTDLRVPPGVAPVPNAVSLFNCRSNGQRGRDVTECGRTHGGLNCVVGQ